MSKYHIAKGLGLSINSKSAGSITSIGGVEISVDTEDVTSVTDVDGYRRWMPTLRDAGEVAIEGLCDTTDEGQTELQNAKDLDDELPVVITLPEAMKLAWSFNAVVTKYKLGEATPGGLIKFSTSLKISGKPTLAAPAEG